MAVHPTDRKPTFWPFLIGALIGAGSVMFIVYPPEPGWGSSEKWGDIATWTASFATFCAVVVALVIASDERRTRIREREEDRYDANRRAAFALRPSLENTVAIAAHALSCLKNLDGMKSSAIIEGNDGIKFEYLFNAAELDRIGRMNDLAAGVSGNFAKHILATLALCRETSALINKAIQGASIRVLPRQNLDSLILSFRALWTSAKKAADCAVTIAGSSYELDSFVDSDGA